MKRVAQMLGYLEQAALRRRQLQYVQQLPPGTAINTTVLNAKIASFLCPSDGLSPTAGSWAKSNNNYYGSAGTTTFPNGRRARESSSPAQLFTPTAANPYNDTLNAPSVASHRSDGTSNTVAFAEGVVGDQTHWTNFRDGVAWTATPLLRGQRCLAQQSYVMKGIQACAAMWTSKQNCREEDKGWRWGNQAIGSSLFNTIIPPSSMTYPWSGCRADNQGGTVSNGQFENANSFHPGGCNVGFADGSVKFVKSTISMNTWWRSEPRPAGSNPSVARILTGPLSSRWPRAAGSRRPRTWPETGRRSFPLLLLSAWCGLVAGLLEVGTIVVRKQVFDSDHLYRMSRHFVWLIPLTNLCIFVALGFLGCGVILLWPSRGRWLVTRGLGAITLLPCILVAGPRIYSLASSVVALGLAAHLVPLFERDSRRFRRLAVISFLAAALVVASLGASIWVGDWIKQAREMRSPCRRRGRRTSFWSCWIPSRRAT